jgi:hypothetical protein
VLLQKPDGEPNLPDVMNETTQVGEVASLLRKPELSCDIA